MKCCDPTPRTVLKNLRLREHRARVAASTAILVLLASSAAMRNGFVDLDDPQYVKHALISNGLTADGMAFAFTSITGPYWHPLTWTDARPSRPRPPGGLDRLRSGRRTFDRPLRTRMSHQFLRRRDELSGVDAISLFVVKREGGAK
jgi:hypothetical protein